MFSIHYKNWIKRNRDYLQQADDTIQENQLIPPDIVWLQAGAWRSQAVYLEEYIEHNEDRDIYYPLATEIYEPNQWYLAKCYLQHHTIDHHILDEFFYTTPISIWEQHCQIIMQAAAQGMKAYEILQHIPLNYSGWQPEAHDFFQNNNIHNIYQLLQNLLLLYKHNTQLAQHCKLLIQKYIDEIKSHILHNPP